MQPHSVDDVCAPRTPHEIDSAKKSRCNRFVSLGLAEKLNTIIKRENAEVAFFEHQTTTTQSDEILGMSHCTHVYIHVNMYFEHFL